jgi:hypothetical protein
MQAHLNGSACDGNSKRCAPRDVLDASSAPAVANRPVRGDYSTGEFRASVTLSECKDLPFSFTWPAVRIGETVHEFGRVSMTPQMMPLTWALPVPTRVEGSPGDS